jgi:hypothetical protein
MQKNDREELLNRISMIAQKDSHAAAGVRSNFESGVTCSLRCE